MLLESSVARQQDVLTMLAGVAVLELVGILISAEDGVSGCDEVDFSGVARVGKEESASCCSMTSSYPPPFPRPPNRFFFYDLVFFYSSHSFLYLRTRHNLDTLFVRHSVSLLGVTWLLPYCVINPSSAFLTK
ncbi:hypothetical protein FRB94_009532 [Tulasnella sp. JGI-2019a]|nr:hypothetical protein FRB94_009532 [Tulasnella sp. JGI-2019a]KAG9025507.1 hypothetical protein FRB95_010091 [Tulasnella sp. JGI-2019a]